MVVQRTSYQMAPCSPFSGRNAATAARNHERTRLGSPKRPRGRHRRRVALIATVVAVHKRRRQS
jgi:hypothetical protein